MPDSSPYFRRQATLAERNARTAKSATEREAWLRVAARWRELAACATTYRLADGEAGCQLGH